MLMPALPPTHVQFPTAFEGVYFFYFISIVVSSTVLDCFC